MGNNFCAASATNPNVGNKFVPIEKVTNIPAVIAIIMSPNVSNAYLGKTLKK